MLLLVMAFIYETENFILESHESPEVDRLDGGHMKISPKVSVVDRTRLNPKLAIELMRFTIVSGRAMVQGLEKQGINIGRINYQDNGNWKPELHVHLYGRAVDAKQQLFGNPILPGHKDSYFPLNERDIECIKYEIQDLFELKEYQDKEWKL